MTGFDALLHLGRRGLVALACSAGLIVPAAAHATTQSFHYTGAEQTFTVPAGVTSIYVVAVSAPGGAGLGTGGGPGGRGARAAGDIAVTPGHTLYVEVGGVGADASNQGPFVAGGFNGGGNGAVSCGICNAGGGGGGASDVRTLSNSPNPTSSLETRLIVAGGGGGGGGDGGSPGGAGGAGGQPGVPSPPCAVGSPCGGGAATASTGGAGGASGSGSDCSFGGGDGTLGIGGEGGGGGSGTCSDGGGGGGGLYGGGGGGGGAASAQGTGGGGGGSSGFGSGTTNTSIGAGTTTTPSITIIYTPGLTVVKAGTGNGTVTSSPAGISCGTACRHNFQAGTVVALTEKPASGSRFAGWSGACQGTGACKLTMNAASSVRARFTKIIPPPDTSITALNTSSAKRKATFTFNGMGGVGPLHFQCKLDSSAWKSCGSPKTYTGLSRGSHTVQVRAVDARGQADPTPARARFNI